MARTAKKSSKASAPKFNPDAVDTTPSLSAKVIVAQRRFGRWYVYFQGVAPAQNVGCACKSAKSAIRYMFLVKAKHGATISQNVLDRLQFEAAKEA